MIGFYNFMFPKENLTTNQSVLTMLPFDPVIGTIKP